MRAARQRDLLMLAAPDVGRTMSSGETLAWSGVVRGRRDLKVVIVGAGLGGIAAAIELRKHEFRDVTMLERAAALGGT